jgi:hypothetical protein
MNAAGLREFSAFNTKKVFEAAQVYTGIGVSPILVFLSSDATLIGKQGGAQPIGAWGQSSHLSGPGEGATTGLGPQSASWSPARWSCELGWRGVVARTERQTLVARWSSEVGWRSGAVRRKQRGGSEAAGRKLRGMAKPIHGQNGSWGLIIGDMQEDLVVCPQGRERVRALPSVSMRRSVQRGMAQRLAPINAAGTRSCGEERRQTFAEARIGSEELLVLLWRGAAASWAASRRSGGEERRRRRGAAASSCGGEQIWR